MKVMELYRQSSSISFLIGSMMVVDTLIVTTSKVMDVLFTRDNVNYIAVVYHTKAIYIKYIFGIYFFIK